MDVDISEARATFETNFFAVINMCQTFVPLLIKSKGTIVQIGSVAGVSLPDQLACLDCMLKRPPDHPLCLRLGLQRLKSSSTFLQRHLTSGIGSVRVRQDLRHGRTTPHRSLTSTSRVNVTTIVTGGVQSRIARTERTLLPNSLYTPIEDQYERRVSHSQHNAMPNGAYARSVVSQVLYGSAPWRWIWPWAQGRKKWIWEGNASWLIWFLSGGWAWNGLFGWLMTRMFGLKRLKAVFLKSKKSN